MASNGELYERNYILIPRITGPAKEFGMEYGTKSPELSLALELEATMWAVASVARYQTDDED